MDEYDSEIGALLQSGTKKYIDPDTGELLTVDQIRKTVYGQKNFWKCYLMDFLAILGVFDSKQVDVFVYIAENTNPSNNLFVGTYSKIAKDVNVSRPTIAKILKKLQAHSFIRKVQNGVWLVNPDILMKGDRNKRQILLTYYKANEPINQLTYSKTKRKQIEENITSNMTVITKKSDEHDSNKIISLKIKGEDDK